MKRLHLALFILLISIISFNCQKDLSFTKPGLENVDNTLKAPITSTLQGNILDENDQPAAGVQITVGAKNSITNENGYFRIVDAALDKNASLVTAEKPGYFKAFRTFNATSGVNQVLIKLLKKSLTATIDAKTGGEVILPNEAKISLPANGFITESNGISYNGSVNVYTSYIDPKSSDINQTIPGSFMADDKNNRRVSLISYGMMAVVLESTSGEKLQIAKNNTAKLTIPIPSSLQSSASSTISLWYVDEQTGLWKEEGMAAKKGGNYEGEVKHFSFWNCDQGIDGIALSLTLKNQQGLPIIYAGINITSNKYGSTYGYTDSLGQVSGLVPANENLILKIIDQCGVAVDSMSIGPFSQNTNLGSISSNTTSSVSTVRGKLIDCNNSPVSNGYAIINYDNMVRYADVDNDGNFSITFVKCLGSQASCEILGVNDLSQQQGQSVHVSLNQPEINAGNISACGVSSIENINYTFDGIDYNISGTEDSLIAYTNEVAPPLFTTYISGNKSGGSNITFDFNHNQSAGIFSIDKLSVNNFYSIGLIKPFNITVTNYPQNVGEFYEGNFSGQFRDSLNLTPLHTINCSFRIRRIY
jgi:hypothetical protein